MSLFLVETKAPHIDYRFLDAARKFVEVTCTAHVGSGAALMWYMQFSGFADFQYEVRKQQNQSDADAMPAYVMNITDSGITIFLTKKKYSFWF